MIWAAKNNNYSDENIEAKVCQDLILKALSTSILKYNVTIKGGVVMRSISDNARRATQDMDIDFIHYSISNESIEEFIVKLNCLPGIHIKRIGDIEELKHHDYHGKRIYIEITDANGDSIDSKIDIGIHKDFSVEQEEYCFDIACFDDGANLLINSKEQMFTEKLKSLLKLGVFSTRYKDIFDLEYLSKMVDVRKLKQCFKIIIFNDFEMREKNISDICIRVDRIFNDSKYIMLLSKSKKNWLEMSTEEVVKSLGEYIHLLK